MASVTDGPATGEPVAATSVIGPAVLAGAVMLFVHAAVSALLTVVVGTASPGPGAPGGWGAALLWGGAVAAGAGVIRPILRRVARPLAVGAAAGAVAAGGYAALAVGFAAPDASTPLLWARLATLAVAGVAVGTLSRREPAAPRD